MKAIVYEEWNSGGWIPSMNILELNNNEYLGAKYTLEYSHQE